MSNRFKTYWTSWIAIYSADSQTAITTANQAEKQAQAITLLSEIGIAQRYDLHFDHLLGTLIGKKDDLRLYAR